MSDTSRVESLLQEALTISDVHPSKDARAFAGHVAAYLFKCLSDDQLITAEWMMTLPNAKPWGTGSVEVHVKPGWRVSWFDGEVQIEYFVKNMFSQALTLKGVRSRSDLLTLIRLIEGGDE